MAITLELLYVIPSKKTVKVSILMKLFISLSYYFTQQLDSLFPPHLYYRYSPLHFYKFRLRLLKVYVPVKTTESLHRNSTSFKT